MGLAFFLLIGSRHSDTIALLGDDISEERLVHIHQRAALYSLNLLALVIVAAFVVDVARGGDGQTYAILGFVGGRPTPCSCWCSTAVPDLRGVRAHRGGTRAVRA